MKDWRNTEDWDCTGKNFMVSVHRWPKNGAWAWSVHGWVYPDHPFFKEVDLEGDTEQAALAKPPMHRGTTLFRKHYCEDGSVSAIEFAADYQHMFDNYTYQRTKEEASKQFADAERLFDWLAAFNAPVAQAEAESDEEEP